MLTIFDIQWQKHKVHVAKLRHDQPLFEHLKVAVDNKDLRDIIFDYASPLGVMAHIVYKELWTSHKHEEEEEEKYEQKFSANLERMMFNIATHLTLDKINDIYGKWWMKILELHMILTEPTKPKPIPNNIRPPSLTEMIEEELCIDPVSMNPSFQWTKAGRDKYLCEWNGYRLECEQITLRKWWWHVINYGQGVMRSPSVISVKTGKFPTPTNGKSARLYAQYNAEHLFAQVQNDPSLKNSVNHHDCKFAHLSYLSHVSQE